MNHLTLPSTPRCRQVLMVVLTCLAVSHMAVAVSPPPDGGYPGGNTAEGQSALLALTSGTYNTAIGFLSLRNDMTGSYNTGVGAGTLFAGWPSKKSESKH